jgi:hypothetical protein
VCVCLRTAIVNIGIPRLDPIGSTPNSKASSPFLLRVKARMKFPTVDTVNPRRRDRRTPMMSFMQLSVIPANVIQKPHIPYIKPASTSLMLNSLCRNNTKT